MHRRAGQRWTTRTTTTRISKNPHYYNYYLTAQYLARVS